MTSQSGNLLGKERTSSIPVRLVMNVSGYGIDLHVGNRVIDMEDFLTTERLTANEATKYPRQQANDENRERNNDRTIEENIHFFHFILCHSLPNNHRCVISLHLQRCLNGSDYHSHIALTEHQRVMFQSSTNRN